MICAAALALPLCANATQIVPGDYEKTFSIAFPGYKGTTTLENFPVLVKLSAKLNDFKYSKCKAEEGGDLRFADADGNLLASEVDTWDENGTSLVWVKVPSFNTNTVIKAYYGNADPPAVNAQDVWKDNDYVAVWHLGDADSLTQKDSTANGLDFVCADGDVNKVDLAADGRIGGAVGFYKGGNGQGGLTAVDSQNKLAGFLDSTFELWICPTNVLANNRAILSKRDSSHQSYYLYQNGNNGGKGEPKILFSTDGVIHYHSASPTVIATNDWTLLSIVRTGTDGKSWQYYNGKDPWIATITGEGLVGAIYAGDPINLMLGNDKNNSQWAAFPGYIDEVRISNVARSGDWVRASHDCVMEAGFASYETSNDWTQYSHKFSVEFTGAPEGTLTDFPVLVKISEYDNATGEGIPGFAYADCLKPGGGDLRFCDENGTLLYSEVDTWDESGVSLVWVKVPTLTSNTKITAYYGWILAPSVDPAAVWSNGFLGVWHLGDENASSMADSTGGGSTLYEESWYLGSVGTGRSGAVGKAAEFGLRDSDHKGGLRTSASRVMRCGQNAVTAELWAWQDNHDPAENTQRSSLIYELSSNGSTYPTIYEIYEANSAGHQGKIAMWADCEVEAFYLTPANDKPLMPRAEWNYLVFRYDGTDGGANIQNMVKISSGYANRGAFDASIGTSSLFVGCKTTGTANSQYPGKLDEVRISSVARSDAWLKATYDTIKNSATFATYGEAKENRDRGLLIIVR